MYLVVIDYLVFIYLLDQSQWPLREKATKLSNGIDVVCLHELEHRSIHGIMSIHSTYEYNYMSMYSILLVYTNTSI